MNDLQLQEKFIEHCISTKTGFIKPHKMRQAQLISEWSKKPIFDVLMELQLISQAGINEALSETTGYPVFDPLTEAYLTQYSKEVLGKISHKMAVEHRAFPFKLENGKLHMVLANPTDETAVAALEKMAGYQIVRYVCYSKHILRAVVRYYNVVSDKSFENLVHDALDEISGRKKFKAPPSIWTEPLSEALRREIRLFPATSVELAEGEVSITLLVQKIINNAIYLGASDIHFEPFEDVIKVRFRKDGMLFAQWYVPNDLRVNLFNRLKVMSGMDLTVSKRPQDGYISYENLLPVGVDIRASIIPAMHGERAVLRLLDKAKGLLDPTRLGFEQDNHELFQRKIRSPHGLILMTGPTGSGKTTTIYAALSKLNSENRSIITIEDPVEYELQGINQIQVDPRFDMTFTQSFRAVLRQNPDVILLGEIRDPESAQVAVHASSTGHLVFSTLHTNDAANAIPRLISMGCDPYVLADALKLVVGQRLVRRLCESCQTPDNLDEQRLAELGFDAEDVPEGEYFRAVGCAHCNGMGYMGRFGVFELLVPDYIIQEMTVNRAPGTMIHKHAVDQGMLTMRGAAMIKAQRGQTSLDEVIRLTTV